MTEFYSEVYLENSYESSPTCSNFHGGAVENSQNFEKIQTSIWNRIDI